MIPEFFVLVSFFYHFGWVANLIIKRAVLDDLKTLEDKGSQISTCGTCLDFYNIKDQLAIGEITNMYAIVEAMDQADKVVTI